MSTLRETPPAGAEPRAVRDRVEALAADWAPEAPERRVRTALDPADLRALADAGLACTGVAVEHGGLWRGLAASARDYASLTATVARVDPSLALVTAMHPLVHAYWLACRPGDDEREAFEAQAARVRASALAGEFWGTITSEPGSGGDIFRTRAVLGRDAAGRATLTGEKHFGSGSGACPFMVTTARTAPDAEPTIAILDLHGVDPLDPPTGITLRRPWDGFGMSATQSHALHFDAWPVEAHAAPRACMAARAVTAQLAGVLFSAVVLTILEEAVAAARAVLAPRRMQLRAYERVHWVEVDSRAWLARQAFEGMVAAVEAGDGGLATLRGKQSIAELAETALLDLGRVLGGSSFSRSQPWGQWLQDVRALGFLRPPWGLADDALFDLGFAAAEGC